MFGKNSVNPVCGGSGSGGGSGAGAISIYTSLRDAGYDLNPELERFYNDKASGPSRPASPEGSNLDDGVTVGIPTCETPVALYSDALLESFQECRDAAAVVISRMGGEGFDLPRVMTGTEGARNVEGQTDHYLQLDQNEADLLKMVCSGGFGKVILVLNVGISMEMGFLEEGKDDIYNALKGYNFDAGKINAAIWTGFPGNSGFAALGRILNGSVNPSGRTTDTWTMDFKQDPSWNNFGDNRTADGNQYVSNG